MILSDNMQVENILLPMQEYGCHFPHWQLSPILEGEIHLLLYLSFKPSDTEHFAKPSQSHLSVGAFLWFM